MKTRIHVITLLVISATLLILGASSTFVFADPCTATLSYPVIPQQYSNSNAPFVVPVSASCTTYYGSQLYATGSAYDVTSNTGLGSASTVLLSANGGTEFNGQLGFNLPPTSQGDSVQISVSIYSSQGGNLITATSETTQVGAGVQQVQQVQLITTTTVTEDPNQYYSPYPTSYPSSQPNQVQYYQSQPQYQNQNHQAHYYSQFFAQNANNTNLFDYVVIIAIIAAVIIATAGLVLVARRQPPQPTWYPAPPPPPR
jgi:hypothetical protein